MNYKLLIRLSFSVRSRGNRIEWILRGFPRLTYHLRAQTVNGRVRVATARRIHFLKIFKGAILKMFYSYAKGDFPERVITYRICRVSENRFFRFTHNTNEFNILFDRITKIKWGIHFFFFYEILVFLQN